MFQLYKDLVVSQVISAEEFWANRLSLNSLENSLSNNKQDVGISAAFLVRFLGGSLLYKMYWMGGGGAASNK